MANKYDYNLDAFYNEDESSYYLLGAFITDGCIYKNNPTTHACQLSSVDDDWLNMIKDHIGTNLKLHEFSKGYYGLRIIRNDIANWFISHGCKPRKSIDVKFPDVPDKYLPDLLRGLIDGDGSIGTYQYKNSNRYKRSIQFISASIDLINGFQEKTNSLNIKSAIYKKKMVDGKIKGQIVKAKNQIYSLSYSGNNAKRLAEYIYYDNCQLYLPRKMAKATQLIENK